MLGCVKRWVLAMLAACGPCAWRRSRRLANAGKQTVKVVTAVARELVGVAQPGALRALIDADNRRYGPGAESFDARHFDGGRSTTEKGRAVANPRIGA